MCDRSHNSKRPNRLAMLADGDAAGFGAKNAQCCTGVGATRAKFMSSLGYSTSKRLFLNFKTRKLAATNRSAGDRYALRQKILEQVNHDVSEILIF